MGDESLFEYLYIPGFSTTEKTSTTSGRGVGLDVVRIAMNELGGETKITTERDKGTTFSFILPNITAVNISDALMISAGSMTFAFPITSVIASQAISTSEVTTAKGRHRSIVYLGKILPLFDLLEIFGESSVEIKDEQLPVIIVEYKHKRAAFIVSDFLNPQKIVISEFDKHMQVPGLVGTAILSGRKMGLVVDLAGLFDVTFGNDTIVDVKKITSAKACKGDFSLDNEKTSDNGTSPATSTSGERSDEVCEDIDIDQPDSAFLKEVESMLTRLNHELLTLDENHDKKTSDGIFRLIHSIKGNLTMYGAEQPASITHKIETILEKTIRGVLELDENVFDVLFDGSVYLEDVVKSLLQGQKPASVPSKLLEGIEKFDQVEKKTEQTETVDLNTAQVVLDATGEFYLSSRRRDGAVLQQCRIEFDSSDQPRFLLAYLILRRIQRVADVLGTFPAMTDIESGLCDSGLVVLIAPRDSKADLLNKLGKNLKQYYGVTRFDAATFA
jgi:chemotaxis protein histidine kinase CheA